MQPKCLIRPRFASVSTAGDGGEATEQQEGGAWLGDGIQAGDECWVDAGAGGLDKNAGDGSVWGDVEIIEIDCVESNAPIEYFGAGHWEERFLFEVSQTGDGISLSIGSRRPVSIR